MNRFSLICMGLIASLLSGCSDTDGWKARTYPTTGSMTINGATPVNAIVYLMAVDKPVDSAESRPYGRVRDDGTFSVTTYELGDGAPIGEYQLLITWPQPGDPRQDRLKGAFGSPEKSSWRFTIEKGSNQIPPIELTDVEVLPLDAAADAAPKTMSEMRETIINKKK